MLKPLKKDILKFSSRQKKSGYVMCVWFMQEKLIFSGIIHLPYVCRQLPAWILPLLNWGKVTRE